MGRNIRDILCFLWKSFKGHSKFMDMVMTIVKSTFMWTQHCSHSQSTQGWVWYDPNLPSTHPQNNSLWKIIDNSEKMISG